MTTDTLPTTSFGDSPTMADELLGLILAGRKTATCWAAVHGADGAKVGRRYRILDGRSQARAVAQTVELTQRRFDAVDTGFAFDEGEDDRTLASWRAVHEAYFTREGTFAPDMTLWCERFRLVEIIGEGAGQ